MSKNQAPEFKPGNCKAWCIQRDGDGCHLWADIAYNVISECLDDAGNKLLDLDTVNAMAPSDVILAGEWKVTCHMVDPEWINNLPEHDGW